MLFFLSQETQAGEYFVDMRPTEWEMSLKRDTQTGPYEGITAMILLSLP